MDAPYRTNPRAFRQTMSKLRVLICSPPSIFCEGMRVVLERQADFTVIDCAGYEARRLAEVRRLDPDIIIVSADEVCKSCFIGRLREVDADLVARVVVFGRIDDPAGIIGCLRAGVFGFVEDDIACDLLPAKLRQFATGQPVLGSPTISALLDVVTKERPQPCEANFAALAKLTSQERRVLGLMAQGIPTAKIAVTLQLGETTVRTHVHRMKLKLGLRTRDQLIAFAVRSTPLTDPART